MAIKLEGGGKALMALAISGGTFFSAASLILSMFFFGDP